MIERTRNDAEIDDLCAISISDQQSLEFGSNRPRLGRANALSHTVTHEQDATAARGWFDREIRPPKSMDIQLVRLRKVIRTALDEKSIVDQAAVHHHPELRMSLCRHLVANAIEALDRWDGEKHTNQGFLTCSDQDQRQCREQPGGPAATTVATFG